MDNPDVLYHGSLYKQSELMPGFKRSGELTVWDGVESNINLYASSDKDTAVRLGIGSAAEKVFNTDRFIEHDGNLWLYTHEPIDIEVFLKTPVYCYTIPYKASDAWKKNNNPYNNIDTEYTTRNTVRGIQVEQVDVRGVLKGKTVTVTSAPVDVDIRLLNKQYADQTKVYKF